MWDKVESRLYPWVEYNSSLGIYIAYYGVLFGWRVVVWEDDKRSIGPSASFCFIKKERELQDFFEAMKVLINYYRGIDFLEKRHESIRPFCSEDYYLELIAKALKIKGGMFEPTVSMQELYELKSKLLMQYASEGLA